jgi:hypothetical protein
VVVVATGLNYRSLLNSLLGGARFFIFFNPSIP